MNFFKQNEILRWHLLMKCYKHRPMAGKMKKANWLSRHANSYSANFFHALTFLSQKGTGYPLLEGS